jgi:glutamyl-tRNA reductase
LILDLSIPRNVAHEVNNHPLVKVVHLDELSQITDATFEKRRKHIPQAEKILKEVEDEFFVWLEHRKYVPTLKAFKEKIVLGDSIDRETTSSIDTDQIIQKITGQIAAYLRTNPEKAEETVAVLKDVFNLTSKNFNE